MAITPKVIAIFDYAENKRTRSSAMGGGST